MPKIMTALGLMSGTSMDGIDVALVRSDGERILERGDSLFFKYSPQLRTRLLQAINDAADLHERGDRPGTLASVEEEITKLHSDAVSQFLKNTGSSANEIDLLGFHGQTVLHRPDARLTVQLGDGFALAADTGIDTVFDLRANDVENGGQGAPLVPVYHAILAENLTSEFSGERPIAFVNIGGISNVTYVGDELLAFDTGPGNALIDQWVERHVGISHDQDGMIAAEGDVDDQLVSEYLRDPYFDKPAPKSLDRGDFVLPETPGLSVETVARSLARITARSILRSVEHMPEKPALWIICGGGRHNPHILADLRDFAISLGSNAVTAEEVGFDGDAMEAEAWGYLAIRSVLGLPITFPGTTGCEVAQSGGKLALAPKNPDG